MSYFGAYLADIIKLAYANMHPLTHWNKLDNSKTTSSKKEVISDSEGPVYKPKRVSKSLKNAI